MDIWSTMQLFQFKTAHSIGSKKKKKQLTNEQMDPTRSVKICCYTSLRPQMNDIWPIYSVPHTPSLPSFKVVFAAFLSLPLVKTNKLNIEGNWEKERRRPFVTERAALKQ